MLSNEKMTLEFYVQEWENVFPSEFLFHFKDENHRKYPT